MRELADARKFGFVAHRLAVRKIVLVTLDAVFARDTGEQRVVNVNEPTWQGGPETGTCFAPLAGARGEPFVFKTAIPAGLAALGDERYGRVAEPVLPLVEPLLPPMPLPVEPVLLSGVVLLLPPMPLEPLEPDPAGGVPVAGVVIVVELLLLAGGVFTTGGGVVIVVELLVDGGVSDLRPQAPSATTTARAIKVGVILNLFMISSFNKMLQGNE